MAIKIYWISKLGLGSQPAEEWSGKDRTLGTFRRELGLGLGARKTIERVVASTYTANEEGLDFDASFRKPGSGGSNVVFGDTDCPAFQKACDALDKGFSFDMAAAEASRALGTSVSRHAVRWGVQRLLGAAGVGLLRLLGKTYLKELGLKVLRMLLVDASFQAEEQVGRAAASVSSATWGPASSLLLFLRSPASLSALKNLHE
eukprot:scaffold685_cov281-Pinguiococcus_pyrenoidosus.AAC.8